MADDGRIETIGIDTFFSDATSGDEAPAAFVDPDTTLAGAPRARVSITGLKTLWVNTGTLCNLACTNCYIESTPTNAALVYLTTDELRPYLDEAQSMGAEEIGFTGGEPFMNRDAPAMLGEALGRGFSILVLTNAMRPMMRPRVQEALLALRDAYGPRLKLRVSLDHYTREGHDAERGAGAYDVAVEGLLWLQAEDFALSVAGRGAPDESEAQGRRGYAKAFAAMGLKLDADDPRDLVVFPEMDETAATPEISEACWDIVGVQPSSVMCADARMLVKRKGAERPTVLACTLIPYDDRFDLGERLVDATEPVSLNHPHCSRFCVLGGASCSG
ncbi:MAG: radical SAM protein [Parvularculaceae bacterium]